MWKERKKEEAVEEARVAKSREKSLYKVTLSF